MSNLRVLARGLCAVSSMRQAQIVKKSVLRSLLFKDSSQIGRNYCVWKPDGKTVAYIINKNMKTSFCISHVGTEGFVLANGEELFGPTILFPHSLFCWHVQTAADITEESLVMFKLLEPKIDLLVIGYGRKEDFSMELYHRLTKICKSIGVKFEALPTEKAVGVFNFLSHDRMFVAAALIPPTEVDIMKLDKKIFYIEEGDENEEDEEEEPPMIGANKETKFLK